MRTQPQLGRAALSAESANLFLIQAEALSSSSAPSASVLVLLSFFSMSFFSFRIASLSRIYRATHVRKGPLNE